VSLKSALIGYCVTAVVFLALDAAWLTTMADRLYRPALGRLMLDRFDLLPAVAHGQHDRRGVDTAPARPR